MKSRKRGHVLYAFLFSLHTAYLCKAPYANLKIHQSLHIILTIIMTFSDVLIGAALKADKSIDKDDLYTKLLSGFARSASAFDSVPPPYKAWTKTEYFICPSDDGTSRHCRRMTFSNLLDLIYFDLCGAIQRNALPKVCKLCQRIFWEEPGTPYEYCYYIAPCDRFALHP